MPDKLIVGGGNRPAHEFELSGYPRYDPEKAHADAWVRYIHLPATFVDIVEDMAVWTNASIFVTSVCQVLPAVLLGAVLLALAALAFSLWFSFATKAGLRWSVVYRLGLVATGALIGVYL